MSDMEKVFISDMFVCESADEYVDETKPDSKRKGILRTIRGPLAEWDSLNRNKRKYSERLWDNVLESPYVKEQLGYNTLFGEANHPQDRYEVDFARVSHSITKLWKVPATNQIYGEINILDTPLGRIINTLYEAGGIIGYSSRAGGVLHQHKDYTEVDEKTYNFITFDAVPYPSVMSARPVEGLNESVETLEQLPNEVHTRLCSIINESSGETREIVKEFIYSIKGYDMSQEISILDEAVDPKKIVDTELPKEDNTIELLKESSVHINELKAEKQALETQIATLSSENESLRKSLNESLAQVTEILNQNSAIREKAEGMISESEMRDTIACKDSKISELREILESQNDELAELSDLHKALRILEEENAGLKATIREQESRITESTKTISESVVSQSEVSEAFTEIDNLVHELSEKTLEIETLTESVKKLESESLESESTISQLNQTIVGLKKTVEALKTDKVQLVKESTEDIEKSENLVSELREENEQLRHTIQSLQESVNSQAEDHSYRDELISVIASGYNLTVEDVRRKLPENYSKSDIYNVCETISNSAKSGVSYETIAESVVSSKDSNLTNRNQSSVDTTKVEQMMTKTVNRRGVNLLSK